MRRSSPREKTVAENVTIFDIAEEGKGVGRAGEMVVFVEKAVPGDVADVEIFRRKKNFGEAKIVALKTASDLRTEPFCQHFGDCGGCKWQHMTYEAQLHYKQKAVTDALERIAKIDVSSLIPILPSPETRFYRNKLEFTFSDRRWLTNKEISSGENFTTDALGFHVPLYFDRILDIQKCHLQADPSNDIRNSVRDFAMQNGISFYNLRNHEGALRNLIVRTSSTGELMVIVVFAYIEQEQINGMMEFIKSSFPQITSLLYIINQKKNDTIFDQEVLTYSGRDFIYEEMRTDFTGINKVRFRIGPKSFYQTNSHQATRLYEVARDFAGFKGDELVYDLYTGAGTIANFIAGKVKQVIGIEYVESAIEDAKVNSAINNITNTTFFAGDMKDVLDASFTAKNGRPDVIITDPPRAGMHPDVVNRLMEMEAEKIVYVSCNVATQARDLLVLKEKYEVVKIQPVDMFPHTQHVENVLLLQLKK
ncbi:23S rRNA (uracil(1939)-C(5))-methyltransferase RlmD [Mucilaginibacter arboris]|uniref:23S rRNA (Uracil(1939)-C(5))-methyltransferase RlmD n=1 Tax=Mucilaginibacter arboris TaxID=2682090 RepID=A0A7K1T103_9SPHI|nr:23S rRNA (uracil(1939)-C(5))-methyltransferase RlmD [Mucilaginibacter arboris]MVN23253.1 23S rRNA (uracil(1939)-C(5))-methyltransferase RlmD [Mucilaginibacter arboris]